MSTKNITYCLLSCLLTLFMLANTSYAQTSIALKTDVKKQTIDGFGGSIAYYENWVVAHPNRSIIYNYLFRDLGMSIYRTRNMYMNIGGVNAGITDSRAIIMEAKKRGTFDILMSSWSPPGKLKSNGKPANDETMATLASDSAGNFLYGEFAQWWYQSLLEYKAKGIDIKYVSIQNEPNWNPGYEGCIFMPTEQTVFDKKLNKNVKVASYTKAFDAVYDTLFKYESSLNVAPKMIGPEVLGIENAWSGRPGDYTKYMNMSKCYAVAHHLYTGTDNMVTNMTVLKNAYPNIPKMQTEYSDKDWFTLAQIIHNSLVIEDVTAYLVWEVIWPGSDFIDMENPWTSGSWKHPNGFKVGTKYYMFKQYANFIKPGYKRIEASISGSTLKASAFLSGDAKKISVVVINTSTTKTDSIKLNPSGFEIASGNIYRTSETENCAAIGSYSGGTIVLPAKSITTIELTAVTQNNSKQTISEEEQTLIYPNPFKNEATLNLEPFSQNAIVEVYNLAGKVVYREKAGTISNGKVHFDLPNGIYMLSITDSAKRVTHKIIKQN